MNRLSNDLTEFGYKIVTKSDSQERGVKRRHIDTRCFVCNQHIALLFKSKSILYYSLIKNKI